MTPITPKVTEAAAPISLSTMVPTPAPTTTPAGHRILDAAGELFYLRGISNTGVDLVADRAEVTKRTLYQRFGSKDALVATYLQQRAHTWQTYVLDGLRASDDQVSNDGAEDEHRTSDERPPDERRTNETASVERLYDLVEAWAQRHTRGCAFVNAWVEIADAPHPAVAVIRAEKQWMRDLFTALADGEETLSATWHLIYEGAQVSAAIQGTTGPFKTARLASRQAASAAFSGTH